MFYCGAETIRPDCATRKAGAPMLLAVQYSTPAVPDPQAGAPARGATHSGRRFRRLATKTYE